MEAKRIEFRVNIYRFKGRTLMCPENELSSGDILIGVSPMPKIDPLGFFTYVTNEKETLSVSKKRLDRIGETKIGYKRLPYMTHNQEVAAKVKAMQKYLTEYKNKKEVY